MKHNFEISTAADPDDIAVIDNGQKTSTMTQIIFLMLYPNTSLPRAMMERFTVAP